MIDPEAPDVLSSPVAPVELQRPDSPRPSGTPMILAAAMIVLAAVVVAYTLGTRSSQVERPMVSPDLLQPPAARQAAPAFTLQSLRGSDRISLVDFKGRVVVLNFFASWCGPCALEAADLQRTWRANAGRRVAFLGIATQDRYADAQAFLKTHDVTYPAAFDTSGDVMQDYRITGIPTTVFIDPQGRIAGRHAGTFVGEEGVARLHARIDAVGRSAR